MRMNKKDEPTDISSSGPDNLNNDGSLDWPQRVVITSTFLRLSDQVQLNNSVITTLTESTNTAIRILWQKLHNGIAGFQSKVALVLQDMKN